MTSNHHLDGSVSSRSGHRLDISADEAMASVELIKKITDVGYNDSSDGNASATTMIPLVDGSIFPSFFCVWWGSARNVRAFQKWNGARRWGSSRHFGCTLDLIRINPLDSLSLCLSSLSPSSLAYSFTQPPTADPTSYVKEVPLVASWLFFVWLFFFFAKNFCWVNGFLVTRVFKT